jgi:valyl-tRNA synthetase
LQELIRSVRALRVDAGLSADLKLNLALKITEGSDAEICKDYTGLIQLLAGVKDIQFTGAKPAKAIGASITGCEVFVLVEGAINAEQLLARFNKELAAERQFAEKLGAKLSGDFAQKAPADVVAAEKTKLETTRARIEKLTSYINNF